MAVIVKQESDLRVFCMHNYDGKCAISSDGEDCKEASISCEGPITGFEDDTEEPQECYKTGETCEHNCSGLCKESC